MPASHDSRPPPAIKMPAEAGWRVVWVDVVEPEEGTVQIKPIVGVHVEVVTFWGIEAPHVAPDPHLPGVINSDLGAGARISPLHGPNGERLPVRARVFQVVNPRNWQSDDQLRENAFKWLNAIYSTDRKVRVRRRKP